MEKFQDLYGILALAGTLPTKSVPKSIVGLWLNNFHLKEYFAELIHDVACHYALASILVLDPLDLIYENLRETVFFKVDDV